MDYIKVLKLDNTHRVTMDYFNGYYWIQLQQYFPTAFDARADGWRDTNSTATRNREKAEAEFEKYINDHRRIEAKPAIIYYNFKEVTA